MPNLKREDQWLIKVGVTGVNLPKVFSWTTMTGGDLDAEDVKTRPGGMLNQISLGGPSTRNDCTLERNYSNALHPFIVQLENVAGRAAMWASYTPLDGNGNPDGPTVTLTGKLKTVKSPDKNANNTNAAFLQLVMSCDVPSHISQ